MNEVYMNVDFVCCMHTDHTSRAACCGCSASKRIVAEGGSA